MAEEPESSLKSGQHPAKSWTEIWIQAVTRPSVATFEEITSETEINLRRAYVWVFVAALVGSIVSYISSLLGGPSPFGQTSLGQPDLICNSPIVVLFCMLPLTGLFSLLGLIISAGITQWIASLLGGTGTYARLAYAFASYMAPVSVIGSILSAIPYLNCLAIPLAFYSIALSIIATRAVNRFSWGRAIASNVLVFAAILVLFAVMVIVVLALLGPAIGDVFSDIIKNI